MEERKEEIRKEILRQILPPGVDESQLQSAEDQFGPPIDNLNLPQVCGTIHDKNFRDKSHVEPSGDIKYLKNESLQEAYQALAVCPQDKSRSIHCRNLIMTVFNYLG